MKKITDYKFISTKSGDAGTSKNYSNIEYSKKDILFEVLGNIDELSSNLGLLYHFSACKEDIRHIQRSLQTISSLVATSDEKVRKEKLESIFEKDIENIEQIEKNLLLTFDIKPEFVLPGSDTSIEGAYFDLSRSVARRAERSLVRFIDIYKRNDLALSLKYLNRLSDLLFVFARSKADL